MKTMMKKNGKQFVESKSKIVKFLQINIFIIQAILQMSQIDHKLHSGGSKLDTFQCCKKNHRKLKETNQEMFIKLNICIIGLYMYLYRYINITFE